MKSKFFAIVLLLISQLTVGCGLRGSGNIKSETRTADSFTGIRLKSVANIFLTQGDEQSLRIEADDNFISHITTTVKDNILVISSDKSIFSNTHITIYITVKELNKIYLEGSGNITMNNKFKTENMEIKLDGSGDIHAKVDSKSLQFSLAGSGNADFSGSTVASAFIISGSGNINGKDFATSTSDITISGSGTCIVNVKDDLISNITGTGNVYYVNDPEKIESRSDGVGSCSKLKTKLPNN